MYLPINTTYVKYFLFSYLCAPSSMLHEVFSCMGLPFYTNDIALCIVLHVFTTGCMVELYMTPPKQYAFCKKKPL